MTKGKLLRNIVLLLLPVLVYYGVFLVYEPNNYFGLKEKADGTNIMAELRAYQAAPQNAVILGDSRIAKFKPAQMEALTGRSWANLAYGGASLKEQLDILDWALEQNPELDQVVFMASFYTLNKGYSHDRMVIRALDNPFVYLTNLGYNINMLTNLQNHLTGAEIGGEGETMDPDEYKYTDYTDPATGAVHHIRTGMAQHITQVNGRARDWQLNEEVLDRLVETIDDCTAAGIRFTLVLPPLSAEVQTLVIDAWGIAEGMAPALEQLNATDALVLDYEFTLDAGLRGDQFFDGFHLDLERGLDAWAEQLFTAIGGAGAPAGGAA